METLADAREIISTAFEPRGARVSAFADDSEAHATLHNSPLDDGCAAAARD